jgi:hypothetical protein
LLVLALSANIVVVLPVLIVVVVGVLTLLALLALSGLILAVAVVVMTSLRMSGHLGGVIRVVLRNLREAVNKLKGACAGPGF